MKKFKELPPTRKYAVGTVHEISSGEIEIVDRWLGEDGFVILKYRYIETGELEENREVNIASNLAKMRKKKEVERTLPSDALEELRNELRTIQNALGVMAIQQATLLSKMENMERRQRDYLIKIGELESR